MRLAWVILLFFLIAKASAWAATDEKSEKKDSTWTQATNIQQLNPPSTPDSATKVDTTYYIPTVASSDAAQVSNPINYEEHLSQRPTIALFKSMLVPGWGQVGNKKYIKAGAVIGLQAWLFSNALHFGRLAQDEWNRFEVEVDPLTRDMYYRQYQDQRSQRNKYRWFAGIVIFASMFDAYVDAHLSGAPDQVKAAQLGFDVGPDVKGGFSASFSVSF